MLPDVLARPSVSIGSRIQEDGLQVGGAEGAPGVHAWDCVHVQPCRAAPLALRAQELAGRDSEGQDLVLKAGLQIPILGAAIAWEEGSVAGHGKLEHLCPQATCRRSCRLGCAMPPHVQ